MTHLVGFKYGFADPANQWTLGVPSADVHIEKRPAVVHPSRQTLNHNGLSAADKCMHDLAFFHLTWTTLNNAPHWIPTSYLVTSSLIASFAA